MIIFELLVRSIVNLRRSSGSRDLPQVKHPSKRCRFRFRAKRRQETSLSHWSNTKCVFAIWNPATAAPTGGVAHGSDQAGCQTNKMKSTERCFLPPLLRLLRRDGSRRRRLTRRDSTSRRRSRFDLF